MRMVYFDFGHARIQYGSAASMMLRGHEVYFIERATTSRCDTGYTMDVEVGVDKETKRVTLNIIRGIPESSVGGVIPRIESSGSQLMEIVSSIAPDLLITGTSLWMVAKGISRRLGIPLVFWKPAAPLISNVLVFTRYGKRYSRILTAPVSFIYDGLRTHFSTYTFTNDRRTTEVFRKAGARNVKTLWPTYTRFAQRNAYLRFMRDKKIGSLPPNLPSEYVLTMIPLQRGAPSYNAELRVLHLLRDIAAEMPNVDFLVVGSSIEDTEDPVEYTHTENLTLLGKIYDDSCLARLYRQARCVMCPVYFLGFSNRLLEAFFYRKAIVSTPLVAESYRGLRHGSNILLADDKMAACESVELVVSETRTRHELESGAYQYYLRYFHPEEHATAIEKIAFQMSGKGVPTC